MSQLDATVRISAIDNASAVFARVAAHAKSIGQQFRSVVAAPQQQAAQLSAAAAHFERTAATTMLAPTAGVLSFGLLGKTEYDWDKAWNLYRARFEESPAALEALRAKILEVSNATGVAAIDLLGSASIWSQLGGKAQDYLDVMDRITKGSVLMGLTVKEALAESRAMIIAFGENPDDKKTVFDYENWMLTGAKLQKWDGPGFTHAMAQFGPVAGAMHMDKDIAAALAVSMMQGGFEPGVTGRSLKTFVARLMAPTQKTRAALMASGLGPDQLYELGVGKLTDMDALEGRFAASGLTLDGITKSLITRTFEHYADNADQLNLQQVVTQLTQETIESLGIRKGDPLNKQLVASIIHAHVTSAAKGLNLENVFKLGKEPLGLISDIVGKERLPGIAELLRNPQRFFMNLDKFRKRGDDTIERKWDMLDKSFFVEWDRVVARFTNLLRSIGGSGIKDDIVKPFKVLSSVLESLQGMDPMMVRAGFWITSLSAIAPVAALAVGGLAASFKSLAGAARFFVGGPWRAALTALAALGGYAYMENLGGFADALNELAGAAMTLGPIFTDAGQAFDGFYQGIKQAAGISGDANILVDSLTLLADSVRTIAQAFREASAAYNIWKNRDTPDWVPGPAELDQLNRRSMRDHDGPRLPTTWETIPLYRPPWVTLPTRPGEPLLPPSQSSGSLIMDIFKAGAGGLQLPPVSVTGQVSGQMQVTIKVDGPGQVTEQSGGQISGPLNTGQGMTDVPSSSGLPTFGQ